jgi:hypothetical protein
MKESIVMFGLFATSRIVKLAFVPISSTFIGLQRDGADDGHSVRPRSGTGNSDHENYSTDVL